MENIKDLDLEKMQDKTDEEEIVVYGEGCLNDCPHPHSWTSSALGCGTTYNAFISKKR